MPISIMWLQRVQSGMGIFRAHEEKEEQKTQHFSKIVG